MGASEALALGVGVSAAFEVGEADGTAAPVQVVPFSVKLVGTGLVPFQAPLKPNEAVPFVAIDVFHGEFVAVTALPLWVITAFQP